MIDIKRIKEYFEQFYENNFKKWTNYVEYANSPAHQRRSKLIFIECTLLWEPQHKGNSRPVWLPNLNF